MNMINKAKITNYTDSLREVFVAYALAVLLAAIAFSFIEGETFLRSIYWAGITATSTGYGDITPKTTAGMVLAFITTHITILVIAPMIVAKMSEKLMHDENAFTHEEQEQIAARQAAMLATLQVIERKLNEKETTNY